MNEKEKVLGMPDSPFEFYTFEIVDKPNKEGFLTVLCVDHDFDESVIGEYFDLHVDLLVSNVIQTKSGVDITVPIGAALTPQKNYNKAETDLLIVLNII